jgi:hypothetical protein
MALHPYDGYRDLRLRDFVIGMVGLARFLDALAPAPSTGTPPGGTLPEWSPEGWRLNPPAGVTPPTPQPGITLGAYAVGVGMLHPECGTTKPFPPLDGSTPGWWYRNPDSTWTPFDYVAGPDGWQPSVVA